MRLGPGLLVIAVLAVPVDRPQARRAAEAMPMPASNTVVPPGELQAALDRAQPGDRLTLQAGATYEGPFRLPARAGDGWIVVTTSAEGRLPPAGTRVTPDAAPLMPKLVAVSGSVLSADAGAHHYRFVGLEIAPTPGAFLFNVVLLGSHEKAAPEFPHDLIIERCLIHGDPQRGSRRGVALNSGKTTIADSYFADFKEAGADSQAVAGWNGPGPYELVNNYLEAAGENVMFGGADPDAPGMVPSDIVIRRNTMTKPLAWRRADARESAAGWTVKNLLELKNARRVRIDGNVLEHNWAASQNGFAILFTVRNQSGRAPWSVVEDVIFENNVVRHVGGGVNILGYDDLQRSRQASRITIRNNLFDDVGGGWGAGRLFQVLNGTADVRIDHNTGVHSGDWLFGGDTIAHERFVFTNNISVRTHAGGWDLRPDAIAKFFPGADIRGNVLPVADRAHVPPGNAAAVSIADVGFVDAGHGDFRLGDRSAFRRSGTDGRDPGIDASALQNALAAGLAPVHAAPRASGAAVSIFWIAMAVLLYGYAGYAVLIGGLAALRPRPVDWDSVEPSVTVVVVAWNEGARIGGRIANLLLQDYPRNRLEILIASDGSTDDTVARARAFEPAVRVMPFSRRRGKAAVLNDVVPQATGEIVVFADARQRFDAQALRALAGNFNDRRIGAVSGQLVLVSDDRRQAQQGVGLYWRCEKAIRRWESAFDSTVGATGAIYAVRRALIDRIPADTVLDDVRIPLGVVRRGRRVVFEPRAMAYDRLTARPADEFARKARTIAGTCQLLWRDRGLWNPVRNRLWLQTISHKAVRLAAPACHAAALAASLWLLDRPFYRAAFAVQTGAIVAAAVAAVWPAARARIRGLAVAHTVAMLNAATVAGIARFVWGRQAATWERVAAPAPSTTTV